MVIVEFDHQVAEALLRTEGVADRIFFACSQDAADALTALNVPFYTPLDFTDEFALLRYGAQHYRAVERLCSAMDRRLAELAPEFGMLDIEAFALDYYRIKHLHSGAICRLTELLDAFDALKPRQVMAFVSDETQVSGLDVNVQHTCLYGNDVRRICEQRVMDCIHVAQSTEPYPSAPARHNHLLARLLVVIQQGRVRSLLGHSVKGLFQMLFGRRKGGGVLVLQPLVPIRLLASHFVLWKWRIGKSPARIWFPIGWKGGADDRGREVNGLSALDVIEDPDVIAHFVHDGIDWSAFASPYIDEMIRKEFASCLEDCKMADQVFKGGEINVVIAANLGSSATVRRVSSRALKADIPVLALHHGSMGYVFEYSYLYQEIKYCSHYLAYTNAIESYIKRQFSVPLHTRVVGSPHLDQIRHEGEIPSREEICRQYGLNPHKPIVIYPTIATFGRNQNLNMAFENEFIHFKIQNAILDALLASSDIQIIVKSHPHEIANKSAFVRRVLKEDPARVWHVVDRVFFDFLKTADCFVIDMPDTMLLEALTAGRRIYAFNQSYEWDADGAALLEREIVLERKDLKKFCNVLKTDLANGQAFAPRQSGNAFLREFADPFKDGKSEQRVISAIGELAHSRAWVT